MNSGYSKIHQVTSSFLDGIASLSITHVTRYHCRLVGRWDGLCHHIVINFALLSYLFGTLCTLSKNLGIAQTPSPPWLCQDFWRACMPFSFLNMRSLGYDYQDDSQDDNDQERWSRLGSVQRHGSIEWNKKWECRRTKYASGRFVVGQNFF